MNGGYFILDIGDIKFKELKEINMEEPYLGSKKPLIISFNITDSSGVHNLNTQMSYCDSYFPMDLSGTDVGGIGRIYYSSVVGYYAAFIVYVKHTNKFYFYFTEL